MTEPTEAEVEAVARAISLYIGSTWSHLAEDVPGLVRRKRNIWNATREDWRASARAAIAAYNAIRTGAPAHD